MVSSSADVTLGGALENLLSANSLPRGKWYLFILLQLPDTIRWRIDADL